MKCIFERVMTEFNFYLSFLKICVEYVKKNFPKDIFCHL